VICLLERLIVNSIKLYKQKKGIKMKKFLGALIMLMIPSYIFGLAGFGIQLGQDFSKLGEYTDNQTAGVEVKSFEMDKNPVGLGGYAFVDLFGFALEAEGDFAFGAYQFEFVNPLNTLGPVEFAWGRASYAVTLKKNLMDISIPILAKAAINAGVGINGHTSTPRASVDMMTKLLDDDLVAGFDPEDLEDKLIDYLKENKIDASGFHLQAGLRFKVLVLDTHLNLRYTIAENVYDGSNGYAQAMFKIGMAF
jgi:hypothetical protein